jgi:hypothetical protein
MWVFSLISLNLKNTIRNIFSSHEQPFSPQVYICTEWTRIFIYNITWVHTDKWLRQELYSLPFGSINCNNMLILHMVLYQIQVWWTLLLYLLSYIRNQISLTYSMKYASSECMSLLNITQNFNKLECAVICYTSLRSFNSWKLLGKISQNITNFHHWFNLSLLGKCDGFVWSQNS